MAEKMRRTQILLEQQQIVALRKIAAAEGRSVSEVIREIIDHQLAERTRSDDAARKREDDLFASIRRHREEILAERGGRPLEIDPAALLDEVREEADEWVGGALVEVGN